MAELSVLSAILCSLRCGGVISGFWVDWAVSERREEDWDGTTVSDDEEKEDDDIVVVLL